MALNFLVYVSVWSFKCVDFEWHLCCFSVIDHLLVCDRTTGSQMFGSMSYLFETDLSTSLKGLRHPWNNSARLSPGLYAG